MKIFYLLLLLLSSINLFSQSVYISGDSTICWGDSTTLTANGGISYVWSNGATTSSITIKPNYYSTYTVTATLNTGTASDNIIILMNPLPTVDAGRDKSICNGDSVTLGGPSGADTYKWNNGLSGLYISVAPNISTTYTITGTYSEKKGGCSWVDEVFVEVKNCITDNITTTELNESFSIYPNPTNQIIKISFNSIDNINSIEILNTIGQTVYIKPIQTTSSSEQLDLSHLQSGIYFIKVTTDNGNFIKKIVKE